MQADWKAAAERFIERRGYAAAERLRATLQAEWQQLKSIRKRCCSCVPQVPCYTGALPFDHDCRVLCFLPM